MCCLRCPCRCEEPLSSPGISKSITEGIIEEEEEEEEEEEGETNHKRKKEDDQEVMRSSGEICSDETLSSLPQFRR